LSEGTNKIVTENEIRGFVPYENLLDVVDELEKRWTDAMDGYNQDDGRNHPVNVFDTHMDLITLALYVWDFPSRKEKFELQFENKVKNWKPTVEGNYINISLDTDRVIRICPLRKPTRICPLRKPVRCCGRMRETMDGCYGRLQSR
jgi:hypothetical protein